jgi:glycosyltransferase involved in cell wall biosynthesis
MVAVSTIIPVFNGAKTVAAAIESALAQDFDAHEIIVVNDGSTDDTAKVLAAYSGRVRVIHQSNQGPSAARNAGIAIARGKYVSFLDADDESAKDRIAKSTAALASKPSAVLVFSDYLRFDSAGQIVQASTVLPSRAHAPSLTELLENWWLIAPSTVTMVRRAWEQCGGFDVGLKGFEDVEFFLRVREYGEFAYIPETLARFRIGNPAIGPDKWDPDPFVRLAKRRYGARSRKLIQEIRAGFAASFASKALREMEMGNKLGALRCWLKVLHHKPSFMAQALSPGRIARPQNLRRIANMMRPGRSI